MQYYIDAFKQYANFEGRTSRKAFWMFMLFNFLASITISIIDSIFGLACGDEGILGYVYSLAALLPTISISVRRMHDIGNSGWWILFPFVNFFMAFMKGTAGPNKYDTGTPAPSVDEIPSPRL